MSVPVALERAARFWRTARLLHPSQAWWRARLRAQRIAVRHFPEVLERRWSSGEAPTSVSFPAGFTPFDATRDCIPGTADSLLQGEITLLSRTAPLGVDWEHADLPQLWRFHLHYWDWAWDVVIEVGDDAAAPHLEKLWCSWAGASRYGRMDAWAPYVVSLRLWTICGLFHRLASRPAFQDMLRDEVHRHRWFLRANLEFDVGGNHLIKNLKGLIGAAVFCSDHDELAFALAELDRQIEIQVLADGGHFERSPSYHAQVLADLIDIEQALLHSGHNPSRTLADAVDRMRAWLSAMTRPNRTVAVLNDGFELTGRDLDRLAVPAPPANSLLVLSASGYVVLRPAPGVFIAIDCGDPCPDELPGHAHADCLSFELFVGGKCAVVDTGTSEYGDTPRRHYERSTAAHNTVEVDGMDQTEVWGAFRAGRRARGALLSATVTTERIEVVAEHDGYRHLPGHPTHRRTFHVSETAMTITDHILGAGSHTCRSRLLLPALDSADSPPLREIRTKGGEPVHRSDAQMARSFGELLAAEQWEQLWTGRLPVELGWHLEW